MFLSLPQKIRKMKCPKQILITVFALLTLVAPAKAESVWSQNVSAPQSEISEIRIYVNGSTVRVSNAAKQLMLVYSITGECVARYRIDSDEKTITLGLPKGIYIIKVGNVARKISLR